MSSQDRRNVMAVPQVHIQENNIEYAVIKVTCSCGQEITLRCEYVNVNTLDKTIAS
jgi:hypothetical protein